MQLSLLIFTIHKLFAFLRIKSKFKQRKKPIWPSYQVPPVTLMDHYRSDRGKSAVIVTIASTAPQNETLVCTGWRDPFFVQLKQKRGKPALKT